MEYQKMLEWMFIQREEMLKAFGCHDGKPAVETIDNGDGTFTVKNGSLFESKEK